MSTSGVNTNNHIPSSTQGGRISRSQDSGDPKVVTVIGELDFFAGGSKADGTVVFSNGSTYKGIGFCQRGVSGIESFIPDGKGVMTYPDGNEYSGFFRKGLRLGQGVMRLSDGTQIKATYDNDLLLSNEDAELHYSDGSTYVGKINIRGTPDGIGMYRRPDGDLLMGTFRDGFLLGLGKFIKSNGIEYAGCFTNGSLQGLVIVRSPNGARSLSLCIDGVPYKEGLSQPSRVIEGYIPSGIKRSKGHNPNVVIDLGNSGWKYLGKLDNQGLFCGYGALVFPHGRCVYQGEFLEGRFHGQGDRSFDSGARYQGEFQKGHFHGQGVLLSESGEICVGNFVNNAVKDSRAILLRREGLLSVGYRPLPTSPHDGIQPNVPYGPAVLTTPEGRKFHCNIEGNSPPFLAAPPPPLPGSLR